MLCLCWLTLAPAGLVPQRLLHEGRHSELLDLPAGFDPALLEWLRSCTDDSSEDDQKLQLRCALRMVFASMHRVPSSLTRYARRGAGGCTSCACSATARLRRVWDSWQLLSLTPLSEPAVCSHCRSCLH